MRLEAILEIVGRWNQTQEVEDLLVQMAEAATRLVEADRASIFLWDRAAHQCSSDVRPWAWAMASCGSPTMPAWSAA